MCVCASMAVCIQACVNICAWVICVRGCTCEYMYVCIITLIILTDFSKNPEELNFMQIRQVGAELFLADGQTYGITKLIVAFRNVTKAFKKFQKIRLHTL